MLTLLLVLIIVIVARLEANPGIVGGGPADPDAWPSMVSIGDSSNPNRHLCGGSLIDPEWVLTAAHCVIGDSPGDLVAVIDRYDLSTTDGEIIPVSEIISHKDFSLITLDNDIALLKLAMPSNSQTTPYICTNQTILADAGKISTVTGWGALSSGGPSPDLLHQVEVPIVSTAVCNDPTSYNGDITENMMCAGFAAGGKDACQGDSGGPLYVPDDEGGWVEAGIVSWGIGCAAPNFYGVYTRVSQYQTWIESKTGKLSCINHDNFFPFIRQGEW